MQKTIVFFRKPLFLRGKVSYKPTFALVLFVGLLPKQVICGKNFFFFLKLPHNFFVVVNKIPSLSSFIPPQKQVLDFFWKLVLAEKIMWTFSILPGQCFFYRSTFKPITVIHSRVKWIFHCLWIRPKWWDELLILCFCLFFFLCGVVIVSESSVLYMINPFNLICNRNLNNNSKF